MKLSDYITVINGKNQKKVESLDGEYPIYGSGGQMGRATDFICSKNTVIIGRKGTINTPIFVDEPFWNVDTAFGLSPKHNLDAKYLYWFCKHFNFMTISTSTTIPSLTKTSIENIDVRFPSKERQVTISKELDNLQKGLNALKTRDLTLSELVKSRFIEMFGDVFTNDKGYKTCAFGEYVIQMNIGPFGSAMKNDVFVPKNKGYCMVYEQKHAIDKDMNVSARYVDEATYKVLKRFEVGPGDIIVSCRGTIGECFLIPEGSPNGIIHPSLMMIKPKSEVNHKFLVFLLERILAEQTQDGSGVKMAIKAKDLSKIQTIHPSRELQDSFISFVELVDKSRFIVQSQIKDLQELLDSKMDEYFGGDEE